MRVLLVEDNARLSYLLAEGLRRAQWEAHPVGSLEEAEAAVAITEYDVILLDRGLPDGDGLDLIRRWRNRPGAPPVLVMTARGSVKEICEGLDLGADDYIVKPVTLSELVARLNVARRRGRNGAPVISVGALSYDTLSREIAVAGTPFDPAPRERIVLEALLRAMPRPVSKDTLESRLGGLDRTVQANAVEVYVHRLRQRLAENSGAVIQTVRGLGYRLAKAGDSEVG